MCQKKQKVSILKCKFLILQVLKKIKMESQKLFNFQQQGSEAYSSKNYLGWLECHIFLHRLPYRKKILKSISTQKDFIIVLRLPTDRKNKSAFHSYQIIFTGIALKTTKFDIPQREQSSDSTGHKDYRQGCGRDTGNLLKGKGIPNIFIAE